jgi:hypothetical protein
MGLDMYAYGTHSENAIDHFNVFNPKEIVGIHKWRKHARLHGWMERLWAMRCIESGMIEKTMQDPPIDVEKEIGRSIILNITTPDGKITTPDGKITKKPPTLEELRANHPEMLEVIKKEHSRPVSQFNREAIRITLHDLARLEADIKAEALPLTEGPFFGDNEQNETTKADDLLFVAKARKLLSAGFAVYYGADW